jgi:hypothetical protein
VALGPTSFQGQSSPTTFHVRTSFGRSDALLVQRSRYCRRTHVLVRSVWCRIYTDVGLRQPLQERGGTTRTRWYDENVVVRREQKELKAKHLFTASNCPWSTGTIESACKQVIRTFCAVLLKLKIYAKDWPKVLNLVQNVLNNSLSMRVK